MNNETQISFLELEHRYGKEVRDRVERMGLVIPNVNAVEVIRCKDCKWYVIEQLKKDGTDDRRYKPSYCLSLSFHPRPNWFCADGERRDE